MGAIRCHDGQCFPSFESLQGSLGEIVPCDESRLFSEHTQTGESVLGHLVSIIIMLFTPFDACPSPLPTSPNVNGALRDNGYTMDIAKPENFLRHQRRDLRLQDDFQLGLYSLPS